MNEPIKLAFLDCETTGLDPFAGHTIWELAVIVRRLGENRVDGSDFEWEEEHVWQIRPDLNTADPEALDMNGFFRRFKVPSGVDALWFPEFQREPIQVIRIAAVTQIRDVLDGAFLVGAVPSFDAGMLTHLLLGHGLKPSWRHRLVCVETLAAAVLGEPVPQGLRHAATALGVEFDEAGRHTAMGDARLAMAVYDAVMYRKPAPVNAISGGTDG